MSAVWTGTLGSESLQKTSRLGYEKLMCIIRLDLESSQQIVLSSHAAAVKSVVYSQQNGKFHMYYPRVHCSLYH